MISKIIGVMFMFFGLWIGYKILTNDTERDKN